MPHSGNSRDTFSNGGDLVWRSTPDFSPISARMEVWNIKLKTEQMWHKKACSQEWFTGWQHGATLANTQTDSPVGQRLIGQGMMSTIAQSNSCSHKR